ncbi:2-oxo-4-hydroxy-4-carboxy-5-ureidoimidazoline decarboxylase [Nonomuraea rhizosphaerae]|uniref:2-oxo-4-hydroxy-4-carboxy-5-ureidoimidazoline decarboxylase n=1 Tax=Nonomuraea rhizosphaerae TaxID=2665663 RepID=UPI001C5EC096|nr:2-oxo-4-hydroxy-4-carboxy-5-ureidoimidazoline decarboxylase [Nonomuraea rhizosphaerae]
MPITLTGFNEREPAAAEADLLACCASKTFAARVAAGRPYRDQEQLQDAADAAVRALDWPDVLEALSAHPRIGERGKDAWSRQEQAGVEDDTRAALAEGNRAYEERFGHVYLICATGLTGTRMLARLRERLRHDEDAERVTVRDELAKITRLRLAKLLEGPR